jgi:DNA-binding LytR/AlgR family response regulator
MRPSKAVSWISDANHLPESPKWNGSFAKRARIVVRKGRSFVPVLIDDIALCYASYKISFIIRFNGEKYHTDYNLSELMERLDSEVFFRANRKTIINIEAVKEYRCGAHGKIVIDLLPFKDALPEVVVSQFTAPLFKEWIHQ